VHEIRLAIRSLRKAPGFTFGAVVTLALATGATSAMFSAVSAVLFRPTSIHHPEQLVIAWEKDDSRQLDVVELTYRSVEAWAANSTSFSRLAAIGSSTWPAVLDHDDESQRVSSAGVSVSFFETLGVRPELGRGFTPADDAPGAPPVVVLSHRFWQARFGGDSQIVGKSIRLSKPHLVVGVMPAALDFPRGTDYWTPVVPVIAGFGDGRRPENLNGVGVLFVVARLRDGITQAMASDELNRLAASLEAQGSVRRFGSRVVLTSLADYTLGPVRPALWALFGAVAVLLLIGCANVSGLMVTRVSLKLREQALRAALGASRRQLGRPWGLEIAMLAAGGGALGLVFAAWIVRGIAVLAPDDVAGLAEMAIDYSVAAFTCVAVLLTAIVCAVAPVRNAWRVELLPLLGDAGRSTPARQTVRSAFVIAQIALTVVLLVTAGLVARSFANIRRIDIGFAPANVVSLRISPRAPKPSANVWMQTLLDRVSTLPDVESAGAVYLRPLALGAIGQETGVILEGQPLAEASAAQNPTLNYEIATAGYFAAMRIPLLSGRLFNALDGPKAERVVLVGERTAKRLWPGKAAVGQRLLMATPDANGSTEWRTVVGVVGDVHYRGIDDGRFDIYDAPMQSVLAATDVMIRTSGNPLRMISVVTAEARRLDPGVIVDGVTTMDDVVSRAVAPWRFSAWLFAAFAGLAFVLATVGLFSLITFDVSNRRHELAVRLALGAAPRDVVRSVLAAAGTRLAMGVALGVVAALAGTRAIRSLLFGVLPVDIATYVSVLMLVAVVVLTAAYLPARRAGAIDPLSALRQ
jgi:putative ABC transport system permease protein